MESGGAQEVTAGSHDFKRGLSDDALKDEDGLPQAEGHDSSGGVGLAGNSRAAFARDPSRKKQALERESVPVFPVFRSPSQRKTVHLIRHGESEFNAACMGIGPKERNEIFDARLTQRGRAQARSLCKKLQAMACDNVVWVVSPLSRAIETFLLACPDARMLNARLSADTAPSDLPFKVRNRLAWSKQVHLRYCHDLHIYLWPAVLHRLLSHLLSRSTWPQLGTLEGRHRFYVETSRR
mmetsp:Transcript_34982/g.88131  ORF Transcript_34982/g.88131 Transcript_34982/m.88131 type:complete len:238 (+) Transcript_34982:168-881(+)